MNHFLFAVQDHKLSDKPDEVKQLSDFLNAISSKLKHAIANKHAIQISKATWLLVAENAMPLLLDFHTHSVNHKVPYSLHLVGDHVTVSKRELGKAGKMEVQLTG